MAVSNFQIELNEKGAYRAGAEISGHVILNVWSAIEISHIELLLHGRGTLRIFKDTSTFLEMPKHEVYLQQKILLMSPSSGAQTVILQPGRYESAFKYQLPDAVPPSVSQQELRHGCIFDISYMAQANMCRMRRSSVGIIKSTRRSFIILPDLSTSIAHQPISHTEYVKLFCLSMSSKPAKVTVHLNRGIFNPGENIKLKVVVTTAKSTCVQSVSADFDQVTTFNDDMIRKLRRTLVRTGEAHGHHLAATTVGATFVMPVPTNIVPSDLPHCHLLDITYIVKVIVSFKQLAGSLSIRVPITVTPRSTHDHSSQGKSLFSQRMAHFHSFGKPALNTTISTESDNSSREDATTGRHLDEQVITTYKTPVPCCACCLSCMGVGICHFEEK